MSRKSFYFSSSNTRSNEGIEELQRLDQEITLKLQEIDKEFSTSNKIVSEMIMPKILDYQKSSREIWEAVGFWKGFFENSANVDLLTNKDQRSHHHPQSNQLRDDRLLSASREENRSMSEAGLAGEGNVSSSIHGFTSSDDIRRNSLNRRLINRDMLEASNVQTNEVIGEETGVNTTDSLFLEDPTQTKKRLTSSTPNINRAGIKNTSYIGESSSFLPPTLEFYRDKGTSNIHNTSSADRSFRSPVKLSSDVDEYGGDAFQTAHDFSDYNNSSEYHTLRLDHAKKTSILEPPNKQTRLDIGNQKRERLRSRSPSIVDNYTPRRKSRRSSTSSNNGRIGTFASKYDSSPELEPPVLQSDRFFSPTKRGRGGRDDDDDDIDSIRENEDNLVRRKSLENVDNSGQRLERFPQSPKFGAGGLLYRSNNGRGYVLSFKDASTKQNDESGISNNNNNSSSQALLNQTTAIIQNEDSTLDDIVEPELVSNKEDMVQSIGAAISEKYDSDDDVILEDGVLDVEKSKQKQIEEENNNNSNKNVPSSPNPFQESESSRLSSV